MPFFRLAIFSLVLLTATMWFVALLERQQAISYQANVSPPQRLSNEIANSFAERTALPAGLLFEWADECRAESITILTPADIVLPQRRQLAAALHAAVIARCGQAASEYQLAFSVQPTLPHKNQPQSPLRSTLAACLVALIFAIGKWLDYRAGPKHLAIYKLRVKAVHRRFERDSWQRLLWRAVVWTNALLARLFGVTIWSPRSILRSTYLSLVVNLFLAYPLLFAHLGSGPRLAFVGSFPHVLIPAMFAFANVPWDVLSFMAMRELLQRMSNPALGRGRKYLLPTVGTFLGIALFAWFSAGFAVLTGTLLSQLPLTDHIFSISLWVDLLGPLFKSWYPLAMAHPMTAQLKIEELNMGYMGIGAITACLLLCPMVIALLGWRYLGPLMRSEMGKLISAFSEDTKNHFSILAVIPAGIVLSGFWLVCFIEILMTSHF